MHPAPECGSLGQCLQNVRSKTGTFATAPDLRSDFAARLNKKTHRVSVLGAPGGSTIHFQIVSGGFVTGPFSVTIPSVALTSPPNLLTGKVFYSDSSPGLECIVSMRVTNLEPLGAGTPDHHSLWVNGITNGGGFTLDITNIRGNPDNQFFNNNLDQPFAYAPSSDASSITVVARCDTENFGQVTKTTFGAGFTGSGYENFDVAVSTEVTMDVPLVAGFNLIGVPVELTAPMTARDLAEALLPAGVVIGDGPVISVLGWDAASQSFTPWAAANPDTNDFTLVVGKGYFVRTSQSATWSPTGRPIVDSVSLDLTAGFNLVSFPFMTPAGGYTARSLAEALLPAGVGIGDGPVISVLGWDGGSQSFSPWAAANPDTNPFAMDPLGGYFVRMSEAVTGFRP